MTSDRLTLEERRRAFVAARPTWEPRTLAQHLADGVARYGDRPLVVTDLRTYGYREVNARARRIAAGLIALGIQPGEHVAMVMANYPEWVPVKVAISAVGAVAVPVNHLLRGKEMGYVLRQSDSVALVTMESFRGMDYLAALDQVAPGWDADVVSSGLPALRHVVTFRPDGTKTRGGMDLGDLEACGERVADAEVDDRVKAGRAEDLADIIYTSGTTGFPRGAMLTHESMLRSGYASALTKGFEVGRRVLFSLPLYHVFAYVEGLLATTFVGGSIVPQLAFDPGESLEATTKLKANEILLVPTMTTAILEHSALDDYDLSSLRTVMSAAAPAPLRLWKLVTQKLGVREIVTGYGQSETAASTVYTLPDDPLELVSSTVGRPKLGGVAGVRELGRFPTDLECDWPASQYKTVDPFTGSDLIPGEEGELALRGPLVMLGYYHEPDETAAVLGEDGWMRSGDLGTVGPDGYLHLTGRSKELYKCGGELVAPKEVEETLSGRPDVAQAYVVGVPDDRMGEVGWAYVVASVGCSPSDTELIDHCRQNLARFKVPRRVVLIGAAELPMTPTGKVQKFRLVERALSRS